jgi:probable HAF family extracellular repeat protein
MKSRILTCITAMTLFAALVVPVRLRVAAQEQPQTNQLPRYTITDLGTLGGTFSEAVGVNDTGSLAGFSTPPGDAVVHAFLWQKGVMTDLGTLGGPNSVAPEAEPQPNDRRQVVGVSDTSTPDPNGEDFCFFGTHLICLPFVWENGVLAALPTLGGNNGVAWQINNQGQVPGSAENATPDPSCATFLMSGAIELESKPVIWENGKIQELPTISGDLDGTADAINDSGQAVGNTGNCVLGIPFTSSHAVLWPEGEKGGVVDLGNLGGANLNLAFGINNRGQVVGQSGVPGGGIAFHAFLWQNGVMTDLGTLPGDVQSWAETINSRDQAVGTSFDASGNMHPFLWQDGVMMDLNTLIPPDSPWLLLEALGNNDRGQIVGYAFNTTTGEVHGFLATPAPGTENTPLAAPGSTIERPKVVLPENVRKMLQQQPGRRYHFPGPGPTR